jgi:GAF domain-containing protein
VYTERCLSELDDAVRPLWDPVQIQERAAAILGQRLAADHAHCVEIDQPAARLHVRRPFGQSPALAGSYALSDFSRELLERTLRPGETLVIADLTHEPLDDVARVLWVALEARASLTTAVARQDKLAAIFSVFTRQPRRWLAEEIRVVQQAAELTWSRVEHARALLTHQPAWHFFNRPHRGWSAGPA